MAAPRVALLVLTGLVGVVRETVPAQNRADTTPVSLEAASVKRNTSTTRAWSLNPQPGGRFSAQNVPLQQVVLFAYSLRDFQLVNDPAWMRSDRFDIDARAPGDLPLQRTRELVQILLRQRFSFVAHTEMREMPIYALVPLRADGTLGPQLKRSACGRATANDVPRTVGDGCGGVITDTGTMRARGVPLAMLANSLSGPLNTVVVDKSGLSGDFDFTVRWSEAGIAGANAAPAVADAPALTTAVQEQLGLKLQAQRGPVEVLVVDRVLPPTEN